MPICYQAWEREVKNKTAGLLIRFQVGNASKVILRREEIREFVVPTFTKNVKVGQPQSHTQRHDPYQTSRYQT
jgi:hypothetical protein